ncbi:MULTISPECIES: alpha/beta hydrolase [Rhodopseudomonas]|uniref:Alpha/beta hydrolase n=1 Tax=Rhodopseudomonas palustris TaxID=1076 RepID=A0A0D7E3H2_RHOPL|nr:MULTISPECIES: alpha/beta hydrolase [Rhodopseudomonas]KIZ34147.1 alpha/beta hydrolase [Rhodopseudomonas palustris]MDF3814429.1 alpha/beta hydrolase [Rhodopseudomonas sp. BAL398]WOK17851.1 alpha/beta hydrolase [Rhodopseudomonas sp. BAL398]
MNATAPTHGSNLGSSATSATPELPAPVSGERHDIDSFAGRLTYWAASSEANAAGTPLLLIHSINAAGSAYEIKPIYEHYAKSRPVYAIELPGFGHSSRGKRQYTIRMMTDAVHAAVGEIRKRHGEAPIDAAALSLGCEFLARAAEETPGVFRSLALISPTGFDGRSVRWVRGSRAIPWLHSFFEVPLWSEAFWRLLTTRAVIGWFLKKTFGSPKFDKGLLDYDYVTTHQPGAQHAPYYFVSGYLFSQDVLRIYQELPMPVWFSHGVRGDFVDYARKDSVEGKPNWSVTVFQTGAMPHFELPEDFMRSYDEFLARVSIAPVAETV